MAEIWNLSALCRCCLKDGYFRNMHYPYVSKEGGVDVYANWLRETFGITIETPSIPSASDMICEDCIARLSDARQFRRQVEDSELKFQQYCRNEGHVKEEIDDPGPSTKLDSSPVEVKLIKKDPIEVKLEPKHDDDDSDHFDNNYEYQSYEVQNPIVEIPISALEDQKRQKPGQKTKVLKTKSLKTKSSKTKTTLNSKKQWKCGKCSFICKTRTSLVKHQKTVHRGNQKETTEDNKATQPKESKCMGCNIVFESARKLIEHKKTSSECRRIVSVGLEACSACGTKFKSKAKLLTHISRRHQDRQQYYTCDYCGESYKSRSVILRHIKKHMGLLNKYACTICGQTCNDITNVRKHVEQVHENIRPYQCEYCPKNFKTKKTLTDHTMRKHTKETPHKCPICTAGFVAGFELKAHMQMHDKQEEGDTKDSILSGRTYLGKTRKFKCSICYHIFDTCRDHRKHLKLEHGHVQLPFPCPLCNKAFMTKYILKRHMFTHDNGDFVCDFCGNTYQHDYILKQHIKRTHGKQQNEEQDELKEPVKCITCGRLVRNIERHNAMHVKRPYKCELCYRTYSAKNALRRHIKDTHLQMNQYSCDICSNKFIKLKTVYAHRKRKHPDAPPIRTHRQIKIKVDCDDLDDLISASDDVQ